MNSDRVFLLAVIVILAITPRFRSEKAPETEPAGPRFQVGDCIQLDFPKEEWEESVLVYRVMEVGKQAYKLCFVGDHCTRVLDGRDHPFIHSFSGDKYFKRVFCGT